ncbi:hypothetical protein AMK31_05695 [Streptomyces sp. TSRI0107]|nr:hypothetical protein AMK31_05695 [Streptomyces sp. TSRI0107]
MLSGVSPSANARLAHPIMRRTTDNGGCRPRRATEPAVGREEFGITRNRLRVTRGAATVAAALRLTRATG